MTIFPSRRRRPSFALGSVAALAALIAAVGCETPDSLDLGVAGLAEGARAYLEADSVRSLRVGDGTAYHYVWSAKGPWAVHFVVADADRCDLRGVVAPALVDDGGGRGRARVSTMRPAPEAFVGVNGDFFSDRGQPAGPEVSAASFRSAARPALAWSEGRRPWIGLAEVVEGGLRLGETVISSSEPGAAVVNAVGGFPLLLAGGAVVGDLEVEARPGFAAERHPRTAVGLDRDTGELWLVVVDGRQDSYSAGMSLPELTALFQALGVEDALNLDGGGSSTMWIRGQTVNRPSDPTGERPVANSVWLLDLPGRC